MADDFCVSCFLAEELSLSGGGSGKSAARLGDTGGGHGCNPPTSISSASGDVFINNIPAARQGDGVGSHNCPKKPPHGRSISGGSSNVFINGKAAARVGDAIGCGGSVASGSVDVIIGDSGIKSPGYDCLKAAKSMGSAFINTEDLPPPSEPPQIVQPSVVFNTVAESGTPFVD